jgi:hypothetical protein
MLIIGVDYHPSFQQTSRSLSVWTVGVTTRLFRAIPGKTAIWVIVLA